MVCECVSRSRSATWRLIFQEETAPLRQRCYLQSVCSRSQTCEKLSRRRVGWLYSQATHLGSPTSPSLFIIPPFNSQRISVEPSLLLFLFTYLLLVYFTVRMNRVYLSVAYYFKPNLSRRCKHRLGCDGKIQNTWCPKKVHL